VERQGKMREDTYRISQIIADELADLIRRAPEQWHVLEDRFGVRS
jgi:lauroyl/myristoyl acyltransferase